MRRSIRSQQLLLAALFSVALVLQLAFLVNMVQWRAAPDVGWIPMPEFGPKTIGFTSASGEEAGLRRGDRILAVNGKSYETADELRSLIDYRIGHVTAYSLERDGQALTVPVTTRELGLKRVLLQSGLTWVVGMIFLGIGTLVFSMKPYHEASWAFLLMTITTSLFISYMSPSAPFQPRLLYSVMLVVPPFIPASILHLTALFPQRRSYFADRPSLMAAPYLFSLALAILSRSMAWRISNLPRWMLHTLYFYMFVSLVIFLGSTIHTYLRTASVAARLQSLVIFSGLTVALFIPMIELLSNLLFTISFFPHPIVFYLIFLTFFPLSIGYAIARHDLFEIDVMVRRTYGYVLSTVAVLGTYAILASGLNVTFQSAELSSSPLFSVVLALAVVLVFGPLHKRIQRLVDRVFYRQQYDYRKTIRNISKTMTGILDANLIHQTLIGTVVREMFLENGVLLLADPARVAYHVQATEGLETRNPGSTRLSAEDALLRLMQEKPDAVFRHDFDLHPRYADSRHALQQTFDAFRSDLMIPMVYKEEIRGILSLGRKKSGKMFTPEDLDLLTTIVNESVIGLENAKLFQENLEKGRLEEELKIARDIQASMLPDQAPRIEGCQVAARSIPAREVGGDFYDFIEMDGDGTADTLGIVIGDVSGKAVSGAMVMAASRSIFRVLAESHPSVAALMSVSNQHLKRDIKQGMFVATLYGVLHAGQRTLTLANAGQPQPIVCPGDGSKPFYVDTEGDKFPLGIIEDCEYLETRVALLPGTTVVFYTDGVVEAMNDKGELYGFERLMMSLEDGRDLPADALLEKLLDDVSRYVGHVEQHDDLTIVVAKIE